ncbi:MAG: serine/threonine protein kinase [Deltaproteobacteria bacterium]|nr:serine/threonine protein kinase [Deltaproteobacteria bacterium]
MPSSTEETVVTGPDQSLLLLGNQSGNQRLGRFELLMEISHGGMATLYLARMSGPQSFEKLVAVKRIHDHLAKERQFVEMFFDEARIAARIEHPNVASIFDLGEMDGIFYLAMEYVHGENLKDVIRESIRQHIAIPWTIIVTIVAEAARGLHAAHELKNSEGRLLGVVHRDVSPQNIVVSYDGHVKVIDFGVAYAAERVTHTEEGSVKGKLAYMSPEQVAGEPVDRRSDIFSLGIVLHEALCFRRLFKRDSPAAIMTAVQRAEVPPPSSIRPSVPRDLDRIVARALARDREGRYQTAGEFADALERLVVLRRAVVNQDTLGSQIQRLFVEKKKKKDAEIREALHRRVPGPPTKSHDAFVESGSTTFAAGASLLGKARSGAKLWGLVVLGLIVAAAVGIWFMTRQSGSDAPASPPQRVAVRSDAALGRTESGMTQPDASVRVRPRPKPIRLRLAVKPATVHPTIVVGGHEYKAALLDTFLKRGDQPVTIEVRAKGYHVKKIIVVPLGDIDRTVRLVARSRRVRSRTRGREVKEQWFKEPK